MDDLYYQGIRLGAEERAEAEGYDVVRVFHDVTFDIEKDVIGIVAIGREFRADVAVGGVRFY